MYNEDMRNLFKQVPLMKSKTLIHNRKHQKLLIDIGGHWYTEK